MSNTLSTEMRLLHHIVERIFLLKIRRFGFISERDSYHVPLDPEHSNESTRDHVSLDEEGNEENQGLPTLQDVVYQGF